VHRPRSAVGVLCLAVTLMVAGCASVQAASRPGGDAGESGLGTATSQGHGSGLVWRFDRRGGHRRPGAAQRSDVAGTDSPGRRTPSSGERPNVVLITTDDMTTADLRWMPRTRRLLGRTGATFTDSISPHPMCCPARAEILTGQFAQNNGVRTNYPLYGGYSTLDSSNTLPLWLQRAGYRTAFMGKYLNGYGADDDHEVPPGWDYWRATVDDANYDYYDYLVNANGDLQLHIGDYQTDYYAEQTERLVPRLSAGDRPFFLWQSHLAPHAGRSAWTILTTASGWVGATPSSRYNDTLKGLPLPHLDSPAYNEDDVSDKPFYIRRRPLVGPEAQAWLTEAHQRRIESLRSVDDAVARTVDALKRAGELADTLLIFTSDNGFLLGQHRFHGKNVPYEPALRVPLIIRGPSVPAGVRTPATATTVDLAPTVLGATGARAGLPVDGRDLLPVARGQRPGWDTALIQAGPRFPREGPDWFFRGVRTDRYTYVEYRASDQVELYDRRVDPYQLRNLAGDAAYAGVQDELRRRLLQLEDCAGTDCRRSFGPVPPPRSDREADLDPHVAPPFAAR